MEEISRVQEGMSRRGFVAGSILAASGVVAAGLAGCAPKDPSSMEMATTGESADDIPWDIEADVVVAGSGTAAVSAIACDTMGAGPIVILEKDAAIFGGTSVTSGGGQALGLHDWYKEEGIEDNLDDQLTYMQAVVDGRVDEEVQRSFLENSNDYCHWALDTFGWPKWGLAHRGFGDYYGNYPGSSKSVVGRGSWCPYDAEGKTVGAAGQREAYRSYIDGSDNIDLRMGCALEELIRDGGGKVIGVKASEGASSVYIKANNVILGTGGFEHNENDRRFYLPFPIQRTCTTPNNTGDGQRAAARIGAQLVYMDNVFGLPFVYAKKDWDSKDFAFDAASADWYGARAMPHSIMVNHKGQRFCDECAMYDTILRSFGTYDSGTQEFVNIPAYWICDSQCTEQYLLPGYATLDELPEYIFKADTLDELAEVMGIDAEGLKNEVATFNAHAANNEDPVWHRNKDNALMTIAFMGASMSLTGTAPETVIGTIEKAPFYCCRYVPGTCSTNGGLRINGKAQALDVDGEVIEGLYAVGTTACTVADYWTGGATIGQGSVMSYVAAKSITNS